MTLEEARKKIDDIDAQLSELFAERMSVVDSVADIKKDSGAPVMDPCREQLVLDRVRAMSPAKYADYAVSLHKYMMSLSRKRERTLLSSGGTDRDAMLKAVTGTEKTVDEKLSPNVVVQGAPGANSHRAALKMYKDAKIDFVQTWEEVFCSIGAGNYDYGVLPVENSLAGSVTDVYGLLSKYRYRIVKSCDLPVSHCLLGVRGAKLSDINDVYSHPHALRQCSGFFNKNPHFKRIPYNNTALAAKMVASAGDCSKAAIATKECAKIYGLDVLAESIQQSNDNITRFVSVSNRPELHDKAGKISIVFSLPHVTGSLYRALERFALSGFNLTKIESVPNSEKTFEYYFYLDFVGSVRSDTALDLLSALKDELPGFYMLGNYDEV